MRFAAMLVALATLVSLGACAQYDAARQANLRASAQARTAADDASCRSSGVAPGSPAYRDCRIRLENQHAQESRGQQNLANEMLKPTSVGGPLRE